MLSREKILAQRELKQEEVNVEEYGGLCIVRELTASAFDGFQASLQNGDGQVSLVNLRAKLVVRSLRDPATGERVFEDDDAEALGATSSGAVQKVFEVAQELSGITDADVEELAKN